MHDLNMQEIIQISFLSCTIMNLIFAVINMIMIAWMGNPLGSFYEKGLHASVVTLVVFNVIVFGVVFTTLMRTGAATTLS